MDKETFDNFVEKVNKTADARFEAYRRMKRCKIASTFAISMLSFSIVCVNIWQLVDATASDKTVSAVTIMLSVFVLIISLLVSQANYGEREIIFHECGLKLKELKDLASCVGCNTDEAKGIVERYHQILSECSQNNTTSDYIIAMMQYDEWENELVTGYKLLRHKFLKEPLIYWILGIGVPVVLLCYFAE